MIQGTFTLADVVETVKRWEAEKKHGQIEIVFWQGDIKQIRENLSRLPPLDKSLNS